jgi:hypothetical protein
MAKNWWDSYASAEEAKDDWWSSYEAVPQGNAGRGVINPPAEAPPRQFVPTARQAAPVAAPMEDFYQPGGEDFGAAIMAQERKPSILDLINTTPSAQPPIERRGAPVSEEKFTALKQQYDAATPKERSALMQTPGFESSVFKTIDQQYKQSDTGPTAGLIDMRREARRDAYASRGLNPEDANARATQDALEGKPMPAFTGLSSFDRKTFFQSLADKTIAKPMDNSLAGAAIETAGDAVRGVASGYLGAATSGWDALYGLAEQTGIAPDFSSMAREAGKAGRENQAGWTNVKDPKSITKSVFESTTQMLMAAGLTRGFGNASIGLSSGMSAATAYGDARLAGKSHDEAAENAAVNFAAEYLGEKVALPKLQNVIGRMGGKGTGREFARAVGAMVGTDLAGEQLTTAVEDLYAKFGRGGTRPDMTAADYLDDVIQTFKVTIGQAALMGGGGAAMRGIQRATETPASAFSRALDEDIAATQFAPSALDQYARRALDVQSYDENIIRPGQAARVQQDQADLQSSTTAADAAAAADNLSGSLSELLVPGNAVTPIIPPPDITGIITPPLPGVNLETEQQFGLDKLRINPQPAPVETRTFTAQEMGAMPIRDRRALTNQFDQTENEDGTFTFTAKSGAAPSTQVVPAPGAEQTLGTAPVRDVSNQPVLDDNTVRADAQRSLDDWATKNNQAIPAKLDAAPEAETRAVATVANLLGSQFGTRVVAFHDTQPSAVQGVAVGGTAFVNTANVFTNIAKVSLHELKHTIEQIAFTEKQAGLTDTAAQKFTGQIEGIFDDMTDDGKRAYLVNFLHKAELAALDATPDIKESRIQELMQSPVLRSEMTADFMGNRATDKRFWADVAKADPGGFKGFVQKWVSVIDNLMGTLRGKGGQTKTESAKVDQYVRDLAKAKMVAREALIAYRQGTLQQFESAPAASLRQGEVNAQTSVAAGSENLPGATTPSGPGFSEDGGGPVPNYGTARAGAISVLARHYSTTPRQTLSGAYYGQGLKGAERDRLDRSTDPRIKNRVYFYVDQGAGIRPESGVGGYAHEARLDNIYDPQTRLIKPQADSNAFESAVINAGFDGYIAPFGNNQSAVVLLGLKHKAVPVRAIGQPKSAALPAEAAPTTLKKGLLSREASQVDTGNIPGSRMRMGTLEIPAAQVDAANAEMERIGSQIRFSAREVVGPPAPETKDTAVYRDVADKIKLSAAEYNAGMLPLMTGKTGDKTFKTPRIGGVPEVVQWLDQRRAKSGLPKLDINKPEDRTVLAKLLAAEAVAAIRSAGNAVEWYDETVAKTLRIMGVKYPELNTDANARNAFLMATAISSQTMNVEDNLRYASQQYEAFRTTGKFPEVGTGKSAPAMAKNFALANELLADIGPDKLRRFLASTFTKRELELSGFKIGGESMDEKLLGSAVFGPKIGFGFYSNLTGNFEPVTMDMWFMRTVGRLAGTLPAFDPVLFPKQVAKLRAALAETGSADRGVYGSQFDPAVLDAAMKTDEGAIALARQVHSLHNRQFIKERAAFDAGTRIKTALVGAADSIIKSSDKPTDAPASGGERQRLRDVVRQMVDMVEEQTGKRVPPAALQALIWYPEQELYKSLGVKLRVTSQDYAGAAKSLLTKEGFDAKRIDTATKSGPGPARQVAGKPVTGTNQANGRPTGGAVPLKGAERDTFLAERTARANAQVVAAQSLQTIFESLDKRGLAKTRAEAAFTARPDGAQIKYIQENFNDILIQLEDADKVKINCD